jgi:hypothetical protein
MKPYPLAALNHFTTPFSLTAAAPDEILDARAYTPHSQPASEQGGLNLSKTGTGAAWGTQPVLMDSGMAAKGARFFARRAI